MTNISKNGTNQTVAVVITDTGWNKVQSVTNPVISFYLNSGTAQLINTVLLTHDDVHDLFELEIPSTVITATGNYRCYIRGDNIETAILDGEVKGGGMGTPIAYNTFNPTTGTIDTGNMTLTVKDIVSIFNATTGHWMLDQVAAKYGNYHPITIVDGIISLDEKLDTSMMSSDDELVILGRY